MWVGIALGPNDVDLGTLVVIAIARTAPMARPG